MSIADLLDSPTLRRRWESGTCIYAQQTGDTRYPVLCERDNCYAKSEECRTCRKKVVKDGQ